MTTARVPMPINGLNEREPLEIDPRFAVDLRNVRATLDAITRAPGGTLLAPTPVPGSTTGKAIVVGSFTRNTATGSQTVSHDLGVTPKAIILITSGSLAEDSVVASFRWGYGFTDGTDSRSVSMASRASVTPSQTSRRYANKLLTIVKWDDTVAAECDFTSWSASNFVVNWTTADSSAEIVTFVVIGHSAVSAKVKEWTLSTSAGTQAVTGVGFLPQMVLHASAMLSAAGTSAGASVALGAMASGGQWTQAMYAKDNSSTADQAGAGFSSTVAMTAGSATTGLELFRFSLSSLDADGFTVSKGMAPASSTLIASLCLNGFASVKVGSFDVTEDAAPVEQAVTGVGFQALGGMIHGIGFDTADKYPSGFQYDAALTIGVFDSASQVATEPFEDGQQNPVGAGNHTTAQYVYSSHGGGGSAGLELVTRRQGRMQSLDSDGFTINWIKNTSGTPKAFYWAARTTTSAFASVGIPRNYSQAQLATAEKVILLTSLSAFVYNQATSVFDPTSETYTAAAAKRFSIANTQDVVAWSNGTDNLRQYDGSTFGALVTSGTNHAARTLLAFNDRIVTLYTRIGGTDHPTQMRWPVNGDVNDWAGIGSGTLEIIETSNAPLTGGFVLGERAYATKQRELIEIIATGSLSPVFRQESKVRGMGCIAQYSIALGEYFAFFLGPDDVYQWDGQTLTATGAKIYQTLTAPIDYQNTDQIQGAIFTTDAEYWLMVGTDVFIYDYRRDRWFRDNWSNVAAIGLISVGTNFTIDVDASQFVVFGHNDARTIRVDKTVGSFLDQDQDSYVVTRDFEAKQKGREESSPSLLWMNQLQQVNVRATPGTTLLLDASYDRGSTWESREVTIGDDGVGAAFFQLAFSTVRFRLRNVGTSAISWRGSIAYEWEEAGHNLA